MFSNIIVRKKCFLYLSSDPQGKEHSSGPDIALIKLKKNITGIKMQYNVFMFV